MTSVPALLPVSVIVNSDSAIDYLLADIPLFCEGIMGIGIFVFLSIAKQVKLLSIFLYTSTFLSFAAATLDLGQLLAREPRKVEHRINLGTIWGVLYAREVFLALSIGFLNLLFWNLVACCPVQEVEHSTTFTDLKELKQSNSANWNRWGLIGLILKWVSLIASLSVPLLQILWRVLPNQRQNGTIYMAENTVRTTLAAVFSLKLVLNISISPNACWYAFRSYAVSLFALSIEIGLGVGNFVTFAFTETALGRLLRSVEIYLLILHDLYTAFLLYKRLLLDSEKNAVLHTTKCEEKRRGGKNPSSDLGPQTQSSLNTGSKFARQFGRRTRTSSVSWSFTQEGLTYGLEGAQSDLVESQTEAVLSLQPSQEDVQVSESATKLGVSDNQPRTNSSPVSVSPADVTSKDIFPLSDISPGVAKAAEAHQNRDNGSERGTLTENLQFPNARPSASSQQRSSIDEILRQPIELDRSIARLHLVSEPDFTVHTPPKFRNTFNSNKTESTSNRSDFSLSIFPEPPTVPQEQLLPESVTGVSISTAEPLLVNPLEAIPSRNEILDNGGPLTTQTDAILFVGDAAFSSGNDKLRTTLPDQYDETLMTRSTIIDSGPPLRPMILSSMVIVPSQDQGSTQTLSVSSDSVRGAYETGFPSQSLRPLLLGNPMIAVPSLPATMVPLAQRKRNGGTISAKPRRPVIGVPFLKEEKMEGTPHAFERPRPPPLRRVM